VTLGQFNPSIVHPSWLASESLIPRLVADGATIDVIHPELADFTLHMSEPEAVLRVQVLRQRLLVSTEDARLYETVRDLSVGVLTLLRHTPVTKLGINFDCHVAMASDDARNALGQRLAPPAAWSGILEKPALLSLSMKSPREDGLDGHLVVKVEPSNRVPFGVLLAINDQFDLEASAGADKVVDLLKTKWDPSLKALREIVAKVTQ
jgi:hypothetical protein